MTQSDKKTGNLRAVQFLLGHTKMNSTVRYLGVELEDALAIAKAIEIERHGPSSLSAQSCHPATILDAGIQLVIADLHRN